MEHSDYSKQENLETRDSFLTDFVYPDGAFYKDDVLATIYDCFIEAMSDLTKEEKLIVITKMVNSEKSLRDIAQVCKVSYEKVRYLLKSIKVKYPRIHAIIESQKGKGYKNMSRTKILEVVK